MARNLVSRSRPSGRMVRVLVSEVVDGDLAVDGPTGAHSQRREALWPGPWGGGGPGHRGPGVGGG
jgi:hypothetical protein